MELLPSNSPPTIASVLDPPAPRNFSQELALSSRRFLSGLINSKNAVTALTLTPTVFRFSWTIVVVAHLICAVFLAGSAATYSYLTNSIMAHYVQLWSPTKGNEHYGIYAIVCAGVSGIHALRVLQLVYRSLCDRQLVFRRSKIQPNRESRSSSSVKESSKLAPIVIQQQINATDLLKLGWRALFSRTGLFGVEGQHFLTIFVIREVVELCTQTYQAHRSSHLLPRVWLNDILVAMLVMNCWSTIAIQQFLGHNPALERVAALFADAFICTIMVIIVPAILFISYASVFDIPNHRFDPTISLYDPIFMAMFVLEAQLALASSLTDFVAKIVPHFALYLSLVSISGLVTRKRTSVSPEVSSIRVKVRSIPQIPSIPGSSEEVRKPQGTLKSSVWLRVVKGVFCIWGAVVLALHVHAVIVSHSTVVHGCKASTRPWLTSRISCSSLVVNCDKYGTNTANDIIFEQIDTSVLATLTLAHCPALTMPSPLPTFRHLLVLHVYNATVVAWGSEETMLSNPRLSTLIVARSRVSSAAVQGLLLPISLLTVQFCDTNVTSIPLALSWSAHPMTIVAFDYNELTILPAALMSVQVFALSLKGNRLETVPQLAAVPAGYMIYGLELRNNPLRELPETLGSTLSYFVQVGLEATNIAVLPTWTLTQVLGVIYMHNTPYCEMTPPQLQQRNVVCSPRPSTDPEMELPFDIFSKMYNIEQN
ncbi:hypothetical protein V7S43_015577 [Phytophthora oleae]|uniref:Leucine-rich repeat domain, L domain-like n=1 Tax=Phytophthora oleae TaxID=2107226 RepID=A0ABD3F113_9STRA